MGVHLVYECCKMVPKLHHEDVTYDRSSIQRDKIKKLKGHLTSLDAKHQLIKLKLVTTYIIECMNIRTILSELLFVPLEQ